MFEFYRQVNGLYACYSYFNQKWMIFDMTCAVMETTFSPKSHIHEIDSVLSIPAAMKRAAAPSLAEYTADRGAIGEKRQSGYRSFTVAFLLRGLIYEYAPSVMEEGKIVREYLRFKFIKRKTIVGEDPETIVEYRESSRITYKNKVSEPDFPKESELFDQFNVFLLTLPKEDLLDLICLDKDHNILS